MEELLNGLPGNVLAELIAGVISVVCVFLARKPINDFLMYISPAYRRLRLAWSGLVTPLDTQENRRLPFVTLENREPRDMILFTDKGVLIPGVYILHGSVKAGKWLWIVKALLDADCDPYKISEEKLFVGNSVSSTVTPELERYLKGVKYSLSGVSEHKVFVVELSNKETDDGIDRKREVLEKYCKDFECPITFILKTTGFVAVEAGSRAVCLEALSPSECLDFVRHNVWDKDASREVCKDHLGILSGSQLSENDPTVLRQLSRSLWISTLGQPELLCSLIETKKADIRWKERLRLIADNQDKLYAMEGFMSFLTLLALLADMERSGEASKSEKELSLRSLAGACGISESGYAYEHFANVVQKIYRYNIQGHNLAKISRSHLVCFDESKERNLEAYFFDNRFEASALLLKCCNFGKNHDYSDAMIKFVSPALMNPALGIDEEDRRRVGRNLARAIIENLTWNKWDETYAGFEKDWPFADYVTEIRDAFEEEYKRLERENSILAKLERCIDTLENEEIRNILGAVVSREVKDDFVYAETVARGLRIVAANGYSLNTLDALKIDFARLNEYAKSSKLAESTDIIELLSAIALFSLLNAAMLRRDFATDAEDLDKFKYLSELTESVCGRWAEESQVRQLLDAANEYAASCDLSEDRRKAINKLLTNLEAPGTSYLSDAIVIVLREWTAEKICDCIDESRLCKLTGFMVRRCLYTSKLENLLLSATAENWASIGKLLDSKFKPDRDSVFQNLHYAMSVMSASSLMPREELSLWHNRLLSSQKAWYAQSRRNIFVCQFLVLGKSIAEFGSLEAVNRYLELFQEVFCREEAVRCFDADPGCLCILDRLLFLLSNRPLEEMSLRGRRTLEMGLLFEGIQIVRIMHRHYSTLYKEKIFSGFSNSSVCLPKTFAELLLSCAYRLIRGECFSEAYPEAEECCRRAAELLIDGFKDQTVSKELYDDFSLMLSWVCAVMRLPDDGTEDLVRRTLMQIVGILPKRTVGWYSMGMAGR